MTNLKDRILRLPPEKRVVLLKQLKQYNVGNQPEFPALIKGNGNDDVYASYQQEQLWFVDELSSGAAKNNVANLFTFHGQLNREALQFAIDKIIEKHTILKTTIKKKSEKLIQEINSGFAFNLETEDLSLLSSEQKEKKFKDISQSLVNTTFNLAIFPLFRTRLLIMGNNEYRLLWVVHHIAWDAWSLKIFLDDMKEFYNAFLSSNFNLDQGSTLQYADYAVWYRKLLEGGYLAESKKFWQKELEDLEPTEILTDYPRDRNASFEGRRVSVNIERETVQQIKDLCIQNNSTFFIVMLSVFKILLYHHTGQENIVIGTPTANRFEPALENLIGFFVNMVVIKSHVDPEKTYKQFLLETRDKVIECFSHQQIPFEKVVELVNPPRKLNKHPLFQIEFTTESSQLNLQEVHKELKVETDLIHDNASRFDLSFIANEKNNNITITVEYNINLYHELSIQRLMENYIHILEAIAANPGLTISKINKIGNQASLQEEIAKGPVFPVPDDTLVSLFGKQVEKFKSKVAIISNNERITYEELNNRANLLAHKLIEVGVQVESRIGIFVDRSINMVVSILAVLKAGGVYIPLDKDSPVDRIQKILNISKLSCILTDTPLPDQLKFYIRKNNGKVLLLEDSEEKLDGLTVSFQNRILSDNLAYIIFTSGSTGQPKGVMISHRSTVNFILSIIKNYQISDADNLIQYASISFDVSVFDIFSALLSGASLFIASHEERKDHVKLTKFIQKNHITVAELPPAILPLLRPEDLPSLRLLSLGGELPSRDLINRWAQGTIKIFNGYGPTETTVAVTLMACNGSIQSDPPIGRPIDNHTAYVVNENIELVPFGSAGELVIAGPGVARGYCDDAKITAEKFIPNPFNNEIGSRLYRTGDKVRWLLDGNLEFLGRIDRQVKIRGYRIELGEIENALVKLPNIKQAVVELINRGDNLKSLEAFVVGEGEPSEIRKSLLKFIPEYMIPSVIVILEKIPVTDNGKVNYKVLAKLSEKNPFHTKKPTRPLDQVESKLINDIFPEVIGVNNISLSDSFFEIGGNSIQATQIVNRIRSTFEIDISLATFFDVATLHDLSEVIKTTLAAKQENEQVILEALGSIENLTKFEVDNLLTQSRSLNEV